MPGAHPVWSVTGFSNLGEVHYGPRGWKSEVYEWRPAFTMSKGKHTLRWGMDFKRHLENFDEVFRTNGNWSFDGRFTNYPLGDFLLGLPASVNSSPDPFSPLTRYSEIAPYFQDDWKVSSNLTLNLGARYEWVGIPRSSNKSISNLYFPRTDHPRSWWFPMERRRLTTVETNRPCSRVFHLSRPVRWVYLPH